MRDTALNRSTGIHSRRRKLTQVGFVSRLSCSAGITRDDQARDLLHHDVAFLIQRLAPEADDAPVRIRARWSHFEHLAFDGEDVAGINRTRPADLLHANADQSTGDPEVTCHHQPHRQGGGLPAARDQPAEQARTGGRLVEVKRLGIEVGGERLDPVRIDRRGRCAKRLPNRKIFEKKGLDRSHDPDFNTVRGPTQWWAGVEGMFALLDRFDHDPPLAAPLSGLPGPAPAAPRRAIDEARRLPNRRGPEPASARKSLGRTSVGPRGRFRADG